MDTDAGAHTLMCGCRLLDDFFSPSRFSPGGESHSTVLNHPENQIDRESITKLVSISET